MLKFVETPVQSENPATALWRVSCLKGLTFPHIRMTAVLRRLRPDHRARGFSLTEILIAVIIIGILSGMIMISFGRSSDRAQAARLAADLEALKSAVLAYSHEEGSWNRNAFRTSANASDGGLISVTSLSPYLDRELTNFQVIRANDRLLAGFQSVPKLTGGVAGTLAKNAREGGLMTDTGDVYQGGSSIYMLVR